MIGLARALGAVVLAAALLGGLLWLLGNPSLVLLWRAEYLIGGFAALLAAAAVLTLRRRRTPSSGAPPATAVLWARGIGIALGGLLLLVALYVLAV